MAAAPADSPGTHPATGASAGVEKLIVQLSDESWRIRQEAQDALTQLGYDIRPHLLQVLQQTKDEEVRSRLQACLRQIEENRATGVSYISLHLKQASPRQIFAELSRQANVSLRTNPPNLWDLRTWPAIDVDIDRQPFWVAAKEICGKLQLAPQNGGRDMVIVEASTAGRSFLNAPSVVSGGFMVVASTINTNSYVDLNQPKNIRRSTYLQMVVYPEPKLQVLQGSMYPRIEEAVDDKGNSLIMTDMNEYMRPASGWSWDLNVNLLANPDGGARLARLRGAARFIIQTRAASAEISQVMTASDVTRTVNGRRFTLKRIVKRGGTYEVQVVLHRSGFTANEWFRFPLGSFRLLDDSGVALTWLNPGYNGAGGDQVSMNLLFQRQAAIGSPTPGEPARLVWEVPMETREVVVPFEFTDLPLPR